MYTIERNTLTGIADAIRNKTGKSGLIKPEDMAGEIEGIKNNIDLTYLPNSIASNVIASQDPSILSDPSHQCIWGKAMMPPTRTIGGDYIQVVDGAVRKTPYLNCSTILPDANIDMTIYCCFKTQTISSAISTGITVWYSDNAGNSPNYYIQNGKLYASVYGDDTYVCDIDTFHLLAISLNQTTKTANYFLDGVLNCTKEFNNSGRSFTIGCTYIGSPNQTAIDIKYIGIVNACESDETIVSNMQSIMAKLGIEV